MLSDTYRHVLSSSATASSDIGHLVQTTLQATAMDESATGSSSISLKTTATAAVITDTESLSSVKRNLFGSTATPTKLTDPRIEDISLPLINFSFHSPVKRDDVIVTEDVSIHDSVSSAMNQLPPLGGSDKPTVMEEGNDTDNAESYELDCVEDDQWLEGISSSQWGEGHVAEPPCKAVGVATLRRYIVHSITPRQKPDQQDGVTTR